MFKPEDRERVREFLIEKARGDPRISAAAALGSSASGGDRWSDLDLSFAVVDGLEPTAVLDEWSKVLELDFDAIVLFDLPFFSTIYRVFLLPGALQVDLSFTPAADFGARGHRFNLLFGDSVEQTWPTAPAAEYLLGLGVHHCVRAHISIERGRLWQAEYWIHEARDEALELASQRQGLPRTHGRGFDDLHSDVREAFLPSLVRALSTQELRRALGVVTSGLLREAVDLPFSARLQIVLQEIQNPAS